MWAQHVQVRACVRARADHQPSAACYIHVGRGARDPGLAVLGVDLRVGRVASVYVHLPDVMW